MQYRTELTARLICVGVWITSLLAMTPVILYAETTPDHASCILQLPNWYDWLDVYRAFALYVFVLAFVIPVGLISVFYTLVVVRLRRAGPNKQTTNKKRYKNVKNITDDN